MTALILSLIFGLHASVDHVHTEVDFNQQLAEVLHDLSDERPALPVLTQIEAGHRSQTISDVSYQVKLDLVRGLNPQDYSKSKYFGHVKISFRYSENFHGQPLTIDFSLGRVSQVLLNGEVADFNYNGSFITIFSVLPSGHHEIEVEYERRYETKEVMGLFLYPDRKQDDVFLITQFEVYGANRVFPSFDQPDLKAYLDLTVTVKPDWEAISATRARELSRDLETKTLHFEALDHPIPTYVMSIHAGPYVHKSITHTRDDGSEIQLGLYWRPHAELPEGTTDKILKRTETSLANFETLFEDVYPFGDQYDTVLAPKTKGGAMENVGAMIIREGYFTSGRYLTNAYTDFLFSKTIAHELAHMWFGNTITPTWWNNIWVNEGFATYYADRVARMDPDLKTNRASKHYPRKSKYPVIIQSIDDTTKAAKLFTEYYDSIYYRPATILTQINRIFGQNRFDRAVKDLIHGEFRFKNLTGNELLRAFDQSIGSGFYKAMHSWFYDLGYNQVDVSAKCDDNQLSELVVHQRTNTAPRLRVHVAKVALFKDQDRTDVTVRYSGEETLVSVESRKIPCPDTIVPNIDSMAFADAIVRYADKEKAKETLDKYFITPAKRDYRFLQFGEDPEITHQHEIDEQERIKKERQERNSGGIVISLKTKKN